MIRPLTADELTPAAHLAAAAFREDPGFAHILPDDAQRRWRLPSLVETLLRVDAASGGFVMGAFDDGALVGVSSTLPAGAPNPRLLDWLKHWRALAWMLKDPAAILRALALVDTLERLRPAGDDYLHILAVHPARQGHGVGAALLRDAFKSGRSIYLETFPPSNVAWYEARGFTRRAEVSSPSRPTFWTLRRAASRSILITMIIFLAAALTASLASAQTSHPCAPVAGIGCVYVSPKAAADGSAPLFIYFRGWTKTYKGSVPPAERARSAQNAFESYELGRAADAAGAVLLSVGSSDAVVRDADVDALERQVGRNFRRLILAAHSGGYVALDAFLPQRRDVARVIMLDDFYFDDGPDSLGRKVAALVGKGAACAGFYTPHNKERMEQRFKPYLTCPLDAFAPADHDPKVKACLAGYATTGTCP